MNALIQIHLSWIVYGIPFPLFSATFEINFTLQKEEKGKTLLDGIAETIGVIQAKNEKRSFSFFTILADVVRFENGPNPSY